MTKNTAKRAAVHALWIAAGIVLGLGTLGITVAIGERDLEGVMRGVAICIAGLALYVATPGSLPEAEAPSEVPS